MSSHIGRTFLNSCLKTPIDPCNNCPAPIYNRPKTYLGRLSSITPLNATKLATGNSFSTKNTSATDLTEANIWASAGIRSLAKLYDSIPDYCDLHHLTEEEFYSTLDSLRSTCHELKTKPLNIILSDENRSSSTLTTNSSNIKVKKFCKNKSGSNNKNGGKKKKDGKKCKVIKAVSDYGKIQDNLSMPCPNKSLPACVAFEKAESQRNDFQAEVEAFNQTLKDLKDLEEELVSRTYCKQFRLAKSTQLLPGISLTKTHTPENTQTDLYRTPHQDSDFKSQSTLRKAYSFNDVNELSDTNIFNATKAQTESHFNKLTKAESLALKNSKKPSNYFEENINAQSQSKDELPKINIQSPSSENTTTVTTTERPTQKKRKEKTKPIKVPFAIFSITNGKENIDTLSPVHPVARPNLAATLRAEVSRKKLKELQNNCTFFDRTPHIDWEVRKTPAWRSLALNESHKEILALRLATRKAEQALQQREYEFNMELMRQRVKSAPLLLEGATFWGPNVGKLTHKCQAEGTPHDCEGLQRKHKSRHRSRSENTKEMGIDGTRAKFHELRKIYISNGKLIKHARKSERSSECCNNKERKKVKKKANDSPNCFQINDSVEELSSADRALL